MRNPIHTVLSSSTKSISSGPFLASDSDRYINVFDPQTQRLVLNLVAENEVSSLSLYSGEKSESAALEKQVLAAVTNDGSVEFFTRPFFQPQDQSKSASLKARSKQMTRRADATLKLTQSETSSTVVPVVKAAFQGPELVVAWAEGGVIPVFERIKWRNEHTDELLFAGTKHVPKTKSSSAIRAATTNGTKTADEVQVDESRAQIQMGDFADEDVEMQDSRQGASVSDSEEDSDSDSDQEQKPTKEPSHQKTTDTDVEMTNAETPEDQDQEEEEEGGEPSFGDLLRANTSKEVDVEAELEDDVRMGPLVPGKPKNPVQQIPSGVSLSTVLTQSLRTNDTAMLESCFHTSDLAIIRSTIQRLDPSLAATLLQRLAERLSARPGRYGHLLVWVQWTCVAHGGALAGRPDLLKRMATLFKVMDQRSSSLPSLLSLKGKLDMLDAQLGLRQSIRSGVEGLDSENEDNVIYVEGQDDEEDEDSDADADADETKPRSKILRETDDTGVLMNGVSSDEEDSDDGEDESDEQDENANANIIDVEAEESPGSSDAEESLEENEDEDDDDGDEESAGSMVDFVADTDEEESDLEAQAPSQPPPSKKMKAGKGKSKAGSRK